MTVQQDYDFATADFNAVYLGGALLEGSGITRVPWDINAPQPAVVELEQHGHIRGPVLDIGCGLGDNAIYLARRGYQVTAVDAASAAIEQARSRACGTDVEFAVADATSLAGYENRFDTVLDSALFHTLDDAGRRRYAAAAHRSTRPGGRLNLLAFANVPGGMPAPLSVSEETVREILTGAGWVVTDVAVGTFVGVTEAVQQFLDKVDARPDYDEAGRVRLPIWVVRAEHGGVER